MFVVEQPGRGDLVFPVNPEEVTISSGSEMVTHRVIRLGEVMIPRGRRARRVKWRGWLPGEDRKIDLGYVQPRSGWREGTVHSSALNIPGLTLVGTMSSAEAMANYLMGLQDQGEEGRVWLVITGTAINWESYIGAFDYSLKGGYGDIDYAIEFVEHRSLGISGAEADPGLPREEPQDPARPRMVQSSGLRSRSALAAPPATFVARGGMSWLQLSHAVYGTTDHANALRLANPTHAAVEQPEAGAVLVVP